MIVATAGHVDHGKSTLVRLMTGTDPDRWAEEKRRGLTIDLGFAHMRRGGVDIGFVDVPGHQRYLSNMLAGCGSVDVALLVISAREGWMPQTEEHLQILDLLGVRHGVVALTHSDVVNESELKEQTLDVVHRLRGTALADAPVVETGYDRPENIDKLADFLAGTDHSALGAGAGAGAGRFRLWVDRSFTIRGSGRVLTGTVDSETLAVGQTVSVFDGTEIGRAVVRSLHQFGRDVSSVAPSSRARVRLSGLKAQPERGWALGRQGEWTGGNRWHVVLTAVRGMGVPIPPRGGYQIFVGTAKVSAQLRYGSFSEGQPDEHSGPGWSALARLHLAESVSPIGIGDRFIVRDEGSDRTVGGGTILAVDTERSVYNAESLWRRYVALGKLWGDPGAVARVLVDQSGGAIDAAELCRQSGPLAGDPLGRQMPIGLSVVKDYVVEDHPFEQRVDDLRKQIAIGPVSVPADKLGLAAAGALVEDGRAELRGKTLTSPGEYSYQDEIRVALPLAWEVIHAAEHGFSTPGDLLADAGIGSRTRKEMVRAGDLVEVGPFLTTRDRFEELTDSVRAILSGNPGTVSEIRVALRLPRRLVVPLLELMDSMGYCMRVGNVRKWTGNQSHVRARRPMHRR